MKTPDQIRSDVDQHVGSFRPTVYKNTVPSAVMSANELVDGIQVLLDQYLASQFIISSSVHHSYQYGTLFTVTVSSNHSNGQSSTWQYMFDPSLYPSAPVNDDDDSGAFDKAMKGV